MNFLKNLAHKRPVGEEGTEIVYNHNFNNISIMQKGPGKLTMGLSKGLDKQEKSFNSISNVILKNRSYERKGNLYKKSLNHHTFKQRQFVLLGEQLFYYKKNTSGAQDKYFNLISL